VGSWECWVEEREILGRLSPWGLRISWWTRRREELGFGWCSWVQGGPLFLIWGPGKSCRFGK